MYFRRLCLSISAALVFLSFTANANDAPLPEDVQVVAPAPEVPGEVAQWSGRWAGSWGGGKLASWLVVERITASGKGECIYAWGQNLGWGINPGHTRVSCQIAADGRSIVLARFGNGAEATFYRESGNRSGQPHQSNS